MSALVGTLLALATLALSSVSGLDRLVVVNTLLAPRPGARANLQLRLICSMPGWLGIGAREQRAVVQALGRSATS